MVSEILKGTQKPLDTTFQNQQRKKSSKISKVHTINLNVQREIIIFEIS